MRPDEELRDPLDEPVTEARVLGALIEAGDDRGVVGDVLALVADDDFGRPAHRLVMAQIRTMVRRGDPVDVATLTQGLKDNGKLSLAGGEQVVLALAEHGVGRVRSGPHHAKRVAELSRRRKLREVALSVAREVGTRLDDDGFAAELAGRILRAPSAPRTAQVVDGVTWAAEAWRRLESKVEGEAPMGVSCGLAYFDRTGGLERSEVLVLAGRPGGGKTGLALRQAVGAADLGAEVLIVSLEMSGEDLALRAFAGRSGTDGDKLRDPRRMHVEDWTRVSTAIGDMDRALQRLRVVAPEDGLTVDGLVALVLREHAIRPIDLIVLDYTQLLKAIGRTREEEVSQASRALKTLAKQTNAAVVGLAQLNRALEQRNEGAAPRLADLRDSGQLEQDAATVVVLSPYFQAPGEPVVKRDDMRFGYVLKRRHGRAGTIFGLRFLGDKGPWFEDPEEDL